MSPDKLVHMANQIALFMESKPHSEGVAGFADHINDFWEPRMRSQFLALVAQSTQDFRPLVLEAVPLIKRPIAA
jgi:formate dehydrogenase subunit delta